MTKGVLIIIQQKDRVQAFNDDVGFFFRKALLGKVFIITRKKERKTDF